MADDVPPTFAPIKPAPRPSNLPQGTCVLLISPTSGKAAVKTLIDREKASVHPRPS